MENSLAPPLRKEERSEIRLIAASPAMGADSLPPADLPRSSARPTVPIGPPVRVVVSEQDIVSQALPKLRALSPSLAPVPVPVPAPGPAPAPRVMLPTIVAPPVVEPRLAEPTPTPLPAPAKPRGWAAPTAAVVAIGLGALAVFGATTDLGKRLDRGLHNMYAIHVTHSFRVNEESPEAEHSLRERLEAPAAPVQLDAPVKF